MNIDNQMATWKVIETVSGEIEAVSGPAAQDRPGAQEWTVWQGTAADKAEALKSAEKADPRVDLEWMCIRHENDPNNGQDLVRLASKGRKLQWRLGVADPTRAEGHPDVPNLRAAERRIP
jgi:hypothetical protein